MKKKKILSAALASLLALSSLTVFASCGKKGDDEPIKEKRTNVYSSTEIALPEGIQYINQMYYAKGNMYLTYNMDYTITYNELGVEVDRRPGYYYQVQEEEVHAEAPVPGGGIVEPGQNEGGETLPEGWSFGYDSVQMLCTLPLDGSPSTEVPLDVGEEYGFVNNLFIGPDGTVSAFANKWEYNEETDTSETQYSILQIDPASGTVGNSVLLNEPLEKAGMDLQNMYINQIVSASDGSYYLTADTTILHFSKDFAFDGKLELENGWINTLNAVGDRVILTYYTEGNGVGCKFIEDNKFVDVTSENLKKTLEDGAYNLMGMVGDKLYYGVSNGIKAYDFASDTIVDILDYINSDIDTSYGSGRTVVLEDGRLAMASTDWNTQTTTLQILEKIPDEQMQEEIIVRLGAMYGDFNLKKAIIRFNKQNTGVRIALKTYEQYNNEDNQYQGAITQLNNDIITGNLPDIIMLNSALPVESYFSKGIFLDLNPLMDDEENGLNRAEYQESVFRANTFNDKMYSMILRYTMATQYAKKSIVGAEPGWTFEEMMRSISQMPEGMIAYMETGRDDTVRNLLSMSMASFINWETGETTFESQGFIDFIKYMATCPAKGFWETHYEGMEQGYDEEKQREMDELYGLRFYEDRALFNPAYFGTFGDVMYQRREFASKDIVPIGYPTTTEGSNGAVIVPQLELAISATSHAKKQAWDILKFFMQDEGMAEMGYGFPIQKALLEPLKASAKDNYYYDEHMEEQLQWYKDAGYTEDYIEYMRMTNQPFDEAVIAETEQIISGATEIQRIDQDVIDIVMEELSGFFAGTKTAEETAKVIAGRVRIYVSENS